jgi:hypothetical protein
MNQTGNTIDHLHEEIDAKIYENVQDLTKAGEIVDDVNALGELYMDKIRFSQKQLNNAQMQLNNAQKQLNDTISELEKSQEHARKRSIHMKNLFIVREYINKKFRNYWYEYEEKLNNQITYQMLQSHSTREKIYDDSGYKFAVYILCVNEKIPVLQSFSTELCEFYIQLNEKIHQHITPHSVVVGAIRDLRNATRDKDPIQSEYNITDDVLNEIEQFS